MQQKNITLKLNARFVSPILEDKVLKGIKTSNNGNNYRFEAEISGEHFRNIFYRTLRKSGVVWITYAELESKGTREDLLVAEKKAD